VVPERARSTALDIGGPVATPLGQVDLNTAVFASRIAHPLIVSDADGVTAGGAARLELANAIQPTQTWGAELLLRVVRPLGDDDAPVLRPTSRPYLVVGLLVEQTFRTAVGSARVFVNGENLTNVRQTRFNPLLLPSRGRGGRWSTDAWTEVTGATLNAGVRLGF